MVREQKNNYVALSGEVIQEPTYSHSAGGEDYFTFPLRCLRLSGAEDLLNIILSRSRLEQLDAQPGDRVGLVGQVRSYNNHSVRAASWSSPSGCRSSFLRPPRRTATGCSWWATSAASRSTGGRPWDGRSPTCSWR